MSPVGRIFIVLNLALAAAFLGWASNALSTNEDWRGQFKEANTAHEAAVTDLEGQIGKLRADLSQAQDESSERSRERDRFEAQYNDSQANLAQAGTENQGLRGSVDSISATLKDYDDTISQLNSDKDRAVERANDAEGQRDDATDGAAAAEQARRDAVDAQRIAQTRIGDLEAERTGLQDSVAMLETRLQVIMDVTGTNWEDIVAQPDIDAAVLGVRHDLAPGLVMLNVGKTAGVKRGHTFEIFHGTTYKGQVRVENVQADLSSALIVRAVEGTTMEQGDSASTQIH